MCVTLITRTLPDSRTSPRDRVCARFEPVVSNSCSTSGSCGEERESESWIFKVGGEVCGGRYWVSRWGRRFPAFWLDSKQKMHDLKCVARCRRDVIGWHLWERFWVDILKFFLKKWLIRFRWFLGARSRRMFMEVIFLWSIFRFACLTLYICFLSLFFTLPVFALYSRFLLCEWSVC